jgi:large subunit ribosomal protein L30
MAKIEITLKRSVIAKPETQKKTVASLGLRKVNQTVTHEDTTQIRGQVDKVSHLVTVEEK